MSKPALFDPIRLGSLHLPNRIVIPPMCQYSADAGCMNSWHLMHLGHLAVSGAGLLTIEATAVLPEGRITYADVGLWSDDTEAAIRATVDGIRRFSDVHIGVQLNHAGRKASSEVPWKGGAQFLASDPRGWQTTAPSSVPYKEGYQTPTALSHGDMREIREAFGHAAIRAGRLGLDLIQLHAAHGYLLHQFLSPLTNRRSDAYGGSLEGRMRFPLEVFDAVREAFPSDRPVSVRISATDWVEGGWNMPESLVFSRELERRGCAAIHVSTGGLHPEQSIPVGPSYQVPLAREVKSAINIPVVAVGLITSYEQAEAIIATGDADMIALARGILYDPRWPWHAAAHLGAKVKAPDQYLRCQPRRYKNLFYEGPSK